MKVKVIKHKKSPAPIGMKQAARLNPSLFLTNDLFMNRRHQKNTNTLPKEMLFDNGSEFVKIKCDEFCYGDISGKGYKKHS